MRNYPDLKDKSDIKEVEVLKAEDWQLNCLKMNPSYCCWGNYEDYMSDGKGWAAATEAETIKDGLWGLDDYNEVIHFYFTVLRDSVKCEHCDGSGLNEATKKLSDSWYSFDECEWVYTSENRRFNNKAWMYHLTQDEVDALWKSHRLRVDFKSKPTAEQVNEWAKSGMGHDSINHWICTEARAKRLGVYGKCDCCEGSGVIYTAPKARLALQLWVLHPRKGCSRGVFIKNIEKEEVPIVVEHLKKAAERNAERFSKLVEF